MILMLTAEEWSILLGILEDVISKDCIYVMTDKSRATIKSIILKLGGDMNV